MKHAGKARRAALKIILVTALIAGTLALVSAMLSPYISGALLIGWILFALFTFYFFRDPAAKPVSEQKVIVSPAHGTVDHIDETTEPKFMLGRCRRVSIFLSVADVHVQKAPVSGNVIYLEHTSGRFLNAMKVDSAEHNENVLVGFEPRDSAGERIGIKLIAGLIARRIIPWIKVGDSIDRGERISLIQFGSRCDLYVPLHYRISTKLGAKVIGGETVLAIKD